MTIRILPLTFAFAAGLLCFTAAPAPAQVERAEVTVDGLT